MAARVAVLFGATGGIGSAVARQLAGGDWRVVLVARTTEPLTRLAEQTRGVPISADATRSDQVDRVFAEVLRKYERVDAVAHMVGNILLKPVQTTSDEEWGATLSANLTSAFYTLRAAVRSMQATGGSIVLSSSAAARIGLANHEAIAASKAGIIGLVQSAAASAAPRGIRVNAVAPGLVRTPGMARLTGNEASLKASTALHALGRIGEPEDVARVIAFLLDPSTSWLTGQVVGIDGGLSRVRSR